MLERQLRLSNVIGSALLLGLAATGAMAGCSSSEGRTGSPLTGGDGSGTGGSNSGTGGVTIGSGGNIIVGTGGGGTPDGEYCQNATVDFVPQVPTVYVLVDQSGSIYDINKWIPLRDAVLPVIQTLQADVRFGFGSYTGFKSPGTCSGLNDMGTIALNNYDAIATFYNGLATTKQGDPQTPTALGIQQASALLQADSTPGPKAILLVTADDDNDFCDDDHPICANDAVIANMQIAAAAGIKTFVFALDNDAISDKQWVDFWAQAGQGETPNWPTGLSVDQYSGQVYNQCAGFAPWDAIWNGLGRVKFNPAGTYSPTGGTATAFVNADTSAVAEGIRQKTESLKSCIFDLGASSGVEVKDGADGDIFVEDMNTPIPDDQWKMNSPTVLELVGDACTKWLTPEVTKFYAGFTCDQLIIK